MMMALVNALIQPNYSLVRLDNTTEEKRTKLILKTKDDNRNDYMLNTTINGKTSVENKANRENNFINHIDTYVSNRQTATKRDNKHTFIASNANVERKPSVHIIPHVNHIISMQMESKEDKSTYDRRHRSYCKLIDLKAKLVVNLVTKLLNNLIIMVLKTYLYIKSQIINYKNKYKMKMNDDNININWKTNKETYKSIYRYLHLIDNNRIYFITSKLQALVSKERPRYNTIIWRFAKRNSILEEINEIDLKQKGTKIKLTILDTDRKHEAIWTIEKKVLMDCEAMVKYIEIEDLIELDAKNLVPPKQHAKFNKRISNINANIWIRNGKIAEDDDERQLWMLVEEVEEEDSFSSPRYIPSIIYKT